MTAKEIVELLSLEPLPLEGGYYRESFRSELRVTVTNDVDTAYGTRAASTAIYFLITPETFSVLHRIPQDEVFHFYGGDAVEMLQIFADGTHEKFLIGSDLIKGQRPQAVVPAGVWQCSRLVGNSGFALFGVTVAPGFEFRDMEIQSRRELTESFPHLRQEIERFTVSSKS